MELKILKKIIKFSENNVQAGKLNELVGFLVSSLNNFGSMQQVNDQLKNRSKLLL